MSKEQDPMNVVNMLYYKRKDNNRNTLRISNKHPIITIDENKKYSITNDNSMLILIKNIEELTEKKREINRKLKNLNYILKNNDISSSDEQNYIDYSNNIQNELSHIQLKATEHNKQANSYSTKNSFLFLSILVLSGFSLGIYVLSIIIEYDSIYAKLSHASFSFIVFILSLLYMCLNYVKRINYHDTMWKLHDSILHNSKMLLLKNYEKEYIYDNIIIYSDIITDYD